MLLIDSNITRTYENIFSIFLKVKPLKHLLHQYMYDVMENKTKLKRHEAKEEKAKTESSICVH